VVRNTRNTATSARRSRLARGDYKYGGYDNRALAVSSSVQVDLSKIRVINVTSVMLDAHSVSTLNVKNFFLADIVMASNDTFAPPAPPAPLPAAPTTAPTTPQPAASAEAKDGPAAFSEQQLIIVASITFGTTVVVTAAAIAVARRRLPPGMVLTVARGDK
jgi:hypothetical protein